MKGGTKIFLSGVSHAMETLKEVIDRSTCIVLLSDQFSPDWSLHYQKQFRLFQESTYQNEISVQSMCTHIAIFMAAQCL